VESRRPEEDLVGKVIKGGDGTMQDIIHTLEAANLRKAQLDKLRRFLGHLVREREIELLNIATHKRRVAERGPPTERDLERKLALRVINIGYRRLQETPGTDRVLLEKARAELRRGA
jgi:hypothetical protein